MLMVLNGLHHILITSMVHGPNPLQFLLKSKKQPNRKALCKCWVTVHLSSVGGGVDVEDEKKGGVWDIMWWLERKLPLQLIWQTAIGIPLGITDKNMKLIIKLLFDCHLYINEKCFLWSQNTGKCGCFAFSVPNFPSVNMLLVCGFILPLSPSNRVLTPGVKLAPEPHNEQFSGPLSFSLWITGNSFLTFEKTSRCHGLY